MPEQPNISLDLSTVYSATPLMDSELISGLSDQKKSLVEITLKFPAQRHKSTK